MLRPLFSAPVPASEGGSFVICYLPAQLAQGKVTLCGKQMRLNKMVNQTKVFCNVAVGKKDACSRMWSDVVMPLVRRLLE